MAEVGHVDMDGRWVEDYGDKYKESLVDDKYLHDIPEQTPEIIHLSARDVAGMRLMMADIAHQERVLTMMRNAMLYEFRKEYGIDMNDDWELDLDERTLTRKNSPVKGTEDGED